MARLPTRSRARRDGGGALRELTCQLVASLAEGVLRGRAVDSVVRAFGRHRAKVLGGLVGGAWAALSACASSLGVWGTLGRSLGLLAPPVWVAGGLAGLGAAGGAAMGALSLARSRTRRRLLQGIIGFSRDLVEGGEAQEADERLLRGFLRSLGVNADGARRLLRTTPEEARQACGVLGAAQHWDLARCIYPLVYLGEGVVSPARRRRFAATCQALGLPAGAPRAISRDYRLRLEGQWSYLRQLVGRLNYFAEVLVFDLRELEGLRDLLERLSRFDPRRRSTGLRVGLLDFLGRDPAGPESPLEGQLGEAALVSAYALAQTALDAQPAQRERLGRAFDQLVEGQQGMAERDRRRLRQSRRRVDRLFAESRTRLGRGPD